MSANTSTPSDAHRTYIFGDFALDLDRGALLRAGAEVKLRPQSFAVLSYLVERHGRLVTKDELLDAIWGQTVVTDDSVIHCLIDIRKALGDTSQKMIRTMPRRGYIFDVPVTQDGDPATKTDSWPFIGFAYNWRSIVVFALVLGIALALWWSENRGSKVPTPVPNSIAVLPFEACVSDESEVVLAMGLSMEVINRLAQHQNLNVLPRTTAFTYAAQGLPIGEIAEPLRAEHLLTGVVCRVGSTLVLSAELLDHEGYTTWGDSFEQSVDESGQTSETLAMQLETAVVTELGEMFEPTVVAAVYSLAYEKLLVGREYRRQGEHDKARAALEEALVTQPDYAEAKWERALLQTDYDWRVENSAAAFANAQPLLEEALVLARADLQRDPGGYHANRVAGDIIQFLGRVEEELSYREFHEVGEASVAERQAQAQSYFAEAERYYRAALATNPSSSDIRLSLALTMDKQGTRRRQESLEMLLEGLEWDPLSERLTEYAAFRLVEFGRLREAMERLDRFEALPQGKDGLWWTQFEILQNHGRYDEKLAYHIELLDQAPSLYEQVRIMGHFWWILSDIASLGMFDEAEELYAIVARVPGPPDPSRTPEMLRWARQLFLEDFYVQATGRGFEAATRTIERVAGLSNDEILKAWYVEAGWIARAFWEVGEKDRAIELYEAMQHYQFNTSKWAERQGSMTMKLVWMYMQLGQDDDASSLLEDVVTSLRSEIDGGARHPEALRRLASAYGWQGDKEAAIKMLDLAIDYGAFDMSLCCADLNPYVMVGPDEVVWWDDLKDDPGFIQARSRMRALVEQQRSNISALLAQNDMEQLFAPLMAAD